MAEGRKILYFLGAGASVAAGAYAKVQAGGKLPIPTQGTFWATFLRLCKSNRNRKTIESFLFRYFLGYNKIPSRKKPSDRRLLLNKIDVEEVFTFLSERAGAPSTSSQLRIYSCKVWDSLISEIGPVFKRFPANRNTRQTYRQFIDHHVKSRDAIISFNYDLVFESSLPNSLTWAYDGLEEATGKLRILKPHGSINWELGNKISRVRLAKRSAIVAPSHLKFVPNGNESKTQDSTGYLNQSPEFREIWGRMEKHMRKAKALIFIGYSFPIADLYFSSILRSVLADRKGAPGIVLVNPDSVALGERLQDRFAIKNVVRYFDLEQFVHTTRRNVLSQLD